MARLTKKMIAARERRAATGDFTRSDFEWAMDVGLTYSLNVRDLVGRPVITERDGVRLVGRPGFKVLAGPEYPWLPWDGLVRVWLVEYDGPPVPTVVQAGVSGLASYVD